MLRWGSELAIPSLNGLYIHIYISWWGLELAIPNFKGVNLLYIVWCGEAAPKKVAKPLVGGDPAELPSWKNSRVCKIQWCGKVLDVITDDGQAYVQPFGKTWFNIDAQMWLMPTSLYFMGIGISHLHICLQHMLAWGLELAFPSFCPVYIYI